MTANIMRRRNKRQKSHKKVGTEGEENLQQHENTTHVVGFDLAAHVTAEYNSQKENDHDLDQTYRNNHYQTDFTSTLHYLRGCPDHGCGTFSVENSIPLLSCQWCKCTEPSFSNSPLCSHPSPLNISGYHKHNISPLLHTNNNSVNHSTDNNSPDTTSNVSLSNPLTYSILSDVETHPHSIHYSCTAANGEPFSVGTKRHAPHDSSIEDEHFNKICRYRCIENYENHLISDSYNRMEWKSESGSNVNTAACSIQKNRSQRKRSVVKQSSHLKKKVPSPFLLKQFHSSGNLPLNKLSSTSSVRWDNLNSDNEKCEIKRRRRWSECCLACKVGVNKSGILWRSLVMLLLLGVVAAAAGEMRCLSSNCEYSIE